MKKSWKVNGRSCEVRCPLPTAMRISRSEILRRKQRKGPKMKKSWEVNGRS